MLESIGVHFEETCSPKSDSPFLSKDAKVGGNLLEFHERFNFSSQDRRRKEVKVDVFLLNFHYPTKGGILKLL